MLVIGDEDSDAPVFFETTIILSNTYQERISYSKMIAEELLKIGIKASLNSDMDDDEWDQRVIENDAYPYPYDEQGGFDLSLQGFPGDTFDFNTIWAGYGTVPGAPLKTIRDSVGYYNEEYLALLIEYFAEVDTDRRNAIFQQIQAILYEDMPIIPIFNYHAVSFHNLDYDLPENIMYGLGYNELVSEWGKLNISTNGELTIGIGIGDFTPFRFLNYPIEWGGARLVPNLMFQGLYERNSSDFGQWIPLIANEMPKWSNDNRKATVDIREDVTFADGMPLTSHDIVESYKIYLTPEILSSSNNEDAYEELHYFFTVDSIKAVDNYTVEFIFTQPYAYATRLMSIAILPTHIYGNHTHPLYSLDESVDGIVTNQIINNGTSPLTYGTGPFEMYEWIIEEPEHRFKITHKFKKRDNYWKEDTGNLSQLVLIDRDTEDIIKDVTQGLIDIAIPLNTGIEHLVNFLVFYPVLYPDLPFTTIESTYTQTLIPNMAHPIFGTGVSTPLGKMDILQSPDAARYVRKAISYAIPRQQIIDDLLGGFGDPAILPISQTVVGLDNSLEVHQYNITKAREFMVRAGYDYTQKGWAVNIVDYIVENPLIPILIISVAGLSGFVVNRYTTFRLRNLYRRKSVDEVEVLDYVDKIKKERDLSYPKEDKNN
jgi:ABC-type transport system substrate-binding protein